MISEGGAEVALTQAKFPSLALGETQPVQLNILENDLQLPGLAIRTGTSNEFPTVRIQFEHLSLQQQRRLVELLFCRPGQWKRHRSPGEFQSLLLLFKILLRPRVIFDRQVDVRAIAVAKG